MESVTELSEKQLNDLAKRINSLAKEDRKKEKREFKSKALHNTKILLVNYQKLKAHCEVVRLQLDDDKDTFWDHGFLTLNSLMQNKAKTVRMMRHVDIALENYKVICHNSKNKGEAKRYDILVSLYKNYLTIEDLSVKYDLDRTTILRQRDDALNDLSMMLFGIDIFNNL